MQDVATTVLDSLANNVNVGLMRYSNDGGSGDETEAQGGMVINQIEPIEDARADMKVAINSWSADGWTPLSETLYEATQYFRGGKVYFGGGANSTLHPSQFSKSDRYTSSPNGDTPSITESRDSSDKSLYKSPMEQDCQKNFIVYLTDGEPTMDNEANTPIESLPEFKTVTGAAKCDIEPGLQYNNSGRCTDDLAKWLHESDLRPDKAGVQNVTTYWIGFGDDVKGSAVLKEAAQRGGGEFYEAADTAELTEAFTEIIANILSQTTTFTSPTVAVNAFNRTQNLNFLYMSVFKPSTSYRWLGNIKKYRITPAGVIRDVNNNAAVDPNTGFFVNSAQSYWSNGVDGSDAEMGGAAGELTDPANRKVYSNLTTSSGALSEQLSNLKQSGNLTLANLLLLGENSTVPVAGRPSVTELVDWAYGFDVADVDGDANVTEARMDMGDPLHSRPVTVIYDGPADDPDITLYATTNDGMLQAINASTGQELWSFMPKELLGRIEDLRYNDQVASREYGLDGAVRVVRLDRNNNGKIEEGGTDFNGIPGIQEQEKDKVYLYFGMRRGGSNYYGLDVTDRTAPKLLWTIGPSNLPGVGQTWSAPTVARVNVDRTWPSSNPDKMVLVFGGGYNVAQDTISYLADTVGHRVYMVDALTGSLIWRAGGPTGGTADSGAQLPLEKMTNAIPGDVRVIDLSGDGYADRMYAADLGGRVWRFDIYNGEDSANLVTGGVFASVGTGDLATKTGPAADAASRRFFYAPDVSIMKAGTLNWINVAIGSGHREKPITDKTVVNRFYSLRDHNVFTQVANNQYKAACVSETTPCHQIITDNDTRLVDVTTNMNPTIPSGGVGWKMNLQDVGEKVLSESRTFQNQVYVTTYSPQARSYNPEYCVSTVGLNRLYVVDAATGKPVNNMDKSTDGSLERSKELAQGSIAPEAIFVFPTPDADSTDPTKPMPAVPPICLVGLESCGTGLLNPPVRTYWQQRGTN
jgi:type IV pilus assembly protein PilY1